MEVEFTKRELGETGYNLLKTIKKALDPKNIMNPGACSNWTGGGKGSEHGRKNR
jgi:hypothetical protein